MTNEQAKSELMQIYGSLSEEKKQALDVLMAQAEKTCDIEKSNFDVRQYKLDTDTAYECGYNAGLQAQADGEYILKKDVMCCIGQTSVHSELARKLRQLPSVAIPSAEPCDDAISREATLKPYKGLNDEDTISVWLIRKNIEQQPSVKPQEPYKGMTNGEVIKAMFGDDKVSEFMGYARIMARVGNWFNDGVVAEFDKDWWNSPYEPQESEVNNG